MDIKQSDVESLDSIAKDLRVPELHYINERAAEVSESENSQQDRVVLRFIDEIRANPAHCVQQTIMKRLKEEFDGQPLSVEFNNYAFFSDRLFDVWIRKSKLDQELSVFLSKWRFPYFLSLLNGHSAALHSAWSGLLSSIASSSLGWSGDSPRSKKLLIDMLTEIELALFGANPLNETIFETINTRWDTFLTQHEKRRAKVVDRLVESERGLARNYYFQAKAIDHINQMFDKRFIPESLQQFLGEHWLDVLSAAYFNQEPSAWDEIESLTKQIVMVFCKKGDAAFKYAPNLIEDLSSLADENNIDVDEAAWEQLSHEVMALLQGGALSEIPFKSLGGGVPFSDFGQSFDYPVKGSPIQFSNETSEQSRGFIADCFPDYGQILFVNYLGIKQGLISGLEYKSGLQSKSISILSQDASFPDVFLGTVIGLNRIVENQTKARKMAADKARREADALKAQQAEVEALAKKRIEEIAERTRQLEHKREERKKLEQRKTIIEALQGLNLGAWISVSREGQKKRYKLAVKFAASSKYIFVDRLGVQKLEYKEDDLVEEILSENIEILNDGADFEESLERVVSRIRMSK